MWGDRSGVCERFDDGQEKFDHDPKTKMRFVFASSKLCMCFLCSCFFFVNPAINKQDIHVNFMKKGKNKDHA